MNREEIIRMATEAGLLEHGYIHGNAVITELERFASLVAAAEREACLKVIDEVSTDYRAGSQGRWLSDQFLDAIRARGMP